MKRKLAAVVVLLAVGLGTMGFFVLRPGSGGQAERYLTATVSRTNVASQVVASGTVRAAATFDLAFGADPAVETGTASAAGGSAGSVWLVRSVTAAPGQTVARGTVLATADTATVAATLDIAKANLAAVDARLAVDRAGLTAADRAVAYDSIRAAQQQLAVATASRPGTVAQDTLKLSQTQTALQTAQTRLASDKAAGAPSALVSADQAAITQSQAQLDSLNLQVQLSGAQADAGAQQNTLKLSQAEAAVQAARAKLTSDGAAIPPVSGNTITADESSLAQAQQQVDTLNLQTQATNTQNALNAQLDTLRLSQAQAASQSAQDKLTADQAAGPPSGTIDADQAALAQAQQQLDTLNLVIGAANSQAASQLSSTELQLQAAQDGYASRTAAATPAQLATDRASVASAGEAVRQAIIRLYQATLRSPVDGVVISVNLVPGATAPSGIAVAVAETALEVSATVTETDLPALHLGQATSVTITATGASVDGTVTEIDPKGTASGSGGVVSYPVVVSLQSPPAGIASGMSAQVAVITALAQNVLAVPSVALIGNNGQYDVRIFDAAGQPQLQSVQVGLITTSLAEIQSGLSAGETIITGTDTPRQGTTSTAGGLSGGGGLFRGAGGGGGGGGDRSGGGSVPTPAGQP